MINSSLIRIWSSIKRLIDQVRKYAFVIIVIVVLGTFHFVALFSPPIPLTPKSDGVINFLGILLAVVAALASITVVVVTLIGTLVGGSDSGSQLIWRRFQRISRYKELVISYLVLISGLCIAYLQVQIASSDIAIPVNPANLVWVYLSLSLVVFGLTGRVYLITISMLDKPQTLIEVSEETGAGYSDLARKALGK